MYVLLRGFLAGHTKNLVGCDRGVAAGHRGDQACPPPRSRPVPRRSQTARSLVTLPFQSEGAELVFHSLFGGPAGLVFAAMDHVMGEFVAAVSQVAHLLDLPPIRLAVHER